ncbi:MAG: FAD-binding oxidoreductase [SAR202 cluster bacterium]|nr:FAD-binding oxidoreductase [SAR202 cluster bacterium]
MALTADVVIAGAGVVGCAAAYFLAKQGAAVTVVEGRGIATGPSGYAVGSLNPFTGDGIPGPLEALARASFQMHTAAWAELIAESGVDFKPVMMPHLELALDESYVPVLRALQGRLDGDGMFRTRWLEAEEVTLLDDRLTPESRGALLVESIGILDSYDYNVALAKGAERLGARLVKAEAIGLERQGGRVTAVSTTAGRIDAGAFLAAMGTESRTAGEWLGVPLPIVSLKGQILHLKAPGRRLGYSLHGEMSLVHKADGLVWVGGTEEHGKSDIATDLDGRSALAAQVRRMAPGLEITVASHTACLRPMSPDRLPVIGPAPSWENAYVATGAGRKGVLLAPAIGRAVADMVTKGRTDLPVSGMLFVPQRFRGVCL